MRWKEISIRPHQKRRGTRKLFFELSKKQNCFKTHFKSPCKYFITPYHFYRVFIFLFLVFPFTEKLDLNALISRGLECQGGLLRVAQGEEWLSHRGAAAGHSRRGHVARHFSSNCVLKSQSQSALLKWQRSPPGSQTVCRPVTKQSLWKHCTNVILLTQRPISNSQYLPERHIASWEVEAACVDSDGFPGGRRNASQATSILQTGELHVPSRLITGHGRPTQSPLHMAQASKLSWRRSYLL